MTKDQKLEAIEQMKSHCELILEGDWEMLSARGCLYTLGFHGEDADEVIELIRLGGFTNCLDPSVYIAQESGKTMLPNEDACYWGPDQLLSRLQCLFIR
jgi:hypothetical protein